jgi:hypothetical protein
VGEEGRRGKSVLPKGSEMTITSPPGRLEGEECSVGEHTQPSSGGVGEMPGSGKGCAGVRWWIALATDVSMVLGERFNSS